MPDINENKDEDQFITGSEEESTTETQSCPTCGAAMVYDPDFRRLKCPYCDSISIP